MCSDHYPPENTSIRISGPFLATKYALFAAVATAANIATQYISLSVYSGAYSLYIAMFWGTLVGLAVKYVLDREYIFCCRVQTWTEDLTKFVLYSLMGFVTTSIFWGFEIGFNLLFNNDYAKYFGAVAGLTIGYTSKYHLDKRFVF